MSRVTPEQHARVREQESGHATVLWRDCCRASIFVPESFANSTNDEENVECSLVNKAEGTYPGQTSGHVIHVPHFGTISTWRDCG